MKSVMTQWTKTQLYNSPLLFGAARRILFSARRALRPLSVEGLPGRIHPNDFMADRLLPGRPEAYRDYVKHSKAHFDIISAALHRAGRSWQDLSSAIDFACGYGRVTRWLPTVMPADRITACDIQQEAVEWCANEFGVRPLVADPDVFRTESRQYDSLFSISLVTHLPVHKVDEFLSFLAAIIRPSGVAIFSAHGRVSARQARSIKEYLEPAGIMPVLEDKGIVFVPYRHYKDGSLGDTFLTKDYLETRMARCAPMLSLIAYQEAQFWDMQDCYVLKRAAAAG